jgi:hypothetical protein
MQVQTLKPFTWSYSRLKNFETCPKRNWHMDIAKDVKEDESDALLWGNEAHAILAKRLSKKVPLPPGFGGYEKWCRRIESIGGELYVEQKLGLTRAFGPSGYFDRGIWFRSIADAMVLKGAVAYAGDWKTGKVLNDSVQNVLVAACVFAHRPEIRAVHTEFIWLKDDTTTPQVIHRGDMPAFWATMLPRVAALERAHNLTEYPATPNRLCRRWCAVTSCPHHGGD